MAAATGLIMVILCKLYLFGILKASLPYLIFLFIREGTSILFSLSVIILMWYLGQVNLISRFLSFTGIISYELFLLHGPLLIKYNFLMDGGDIIFPFFIFLTIIFMLSITLNKVVKALQRLPIK
jgi:peptidoglycan/LPS O-acetylase OafA/YrhL